jgi:hypothetical protein
MREKDNNRGKWTEIEGGGEKEMGNDVDRDTDRGREGQTDR